ncbi:anthranilate phosphoribosyltransferase [Jatrophihabitans telluris]|uniref:Anthranilate phosphoribosyltransferase n=1 Tax=Jatrophihabitans telluris TaxID=2038343 RepID=A0ABY4QV08_9ACTN|nr:anthranilate phosphoribosyltransferase [Jatrophihabitans telluris]UQX87248.1 anthranilate phosphoribosyltransferase [Jatrophihabitans telluris]
MTSTVGAASWPSILAALMAGSALSADDTAWAMDEIMAGEATPAQLAAFAVLLRAKGETPTELSGLVRTMLARAVPVVIDRPAVDVVGTGGDRAQTVNISTMSALVAAGAGRTVVKHGNRAASSACGTADVLERLGVVIDLGPAGVARTVSEVGIGFCFAAVFHAGMRFAGAPRRELGVPTVFNFLGPLTNPARPTSAAIGCADRRMAPVMAQVLAERGDQALVFRGDDGLDELTSATTSSVWVVADGRVREDAFDPAAVGIAYAAADALRGGDAEFNAAVVRAVLNGRSGPVRDAVLLNAAATIAAFDGVLESAHAAIDYGLPIAADAIDSGAATGLLENWITSSTAARTP